ncbi:ester cyclase [Deinococcus pimensis]|uniref:ester cyclase n=1 Tax=Deinococcus pimensis TaxID=309888 RepID=UPI00048325AA|nr:ester cyclase [Deinococcus pimensis]
MTIFDEVIPGGGTDHQETPGTDMRQHVVPMMRRAFPDLHFEVGPFRTLAPTGRRIGIRHLHFLRSQDGRNTDLWHLMDTASLMRQLTAPEPQAQPVNR